MNKKILVIIAVVLAAVGFWYITRPDTMNNNSGSAETTNHTVGAGNKGVELIEYGDFQCPACGRFYPIIKQVKEKYGDDLKFTFRHFPLDSIHPNARAAHRAAEAAGLQGKFFEMHDKLYEGQQLWTSESNPYDTLRGYATELGLDMTKFDTDYKSEVVNRAINNDMKAGQALKAASTPTFVLNGTKLDDETMQTVRFTEGLDIAVEDFSKIIDAEIAKKNPGAATPTPSTTPDPSAINEASPTPTPEASATPAATN
jgi:protein-disulfide isomerase